ncbi:MAG: hypothetical protein B6241_05265 [Spirochaetaceae bacterium 4572_59]|nr:MAG: hypothetical protein B6241_05265 [Spirochaetaceae bacterium 4572_59]
MLSLTETMKKEIRSACRDLPEGEVNRMIRRGVAPETLLILGCQTNSVPLIRQALQSGADINGRDRESWTPLMHASYYSNREAVSYLLEQKVRIHSTTDRGESAVAIARTERIEPVIDLFESNLEEVRLKHAGILIEAMTIIEKERQKPKELRDKTLLALSCIDRGYVWWVGEEYPEKVMKLFKKAWELDARVSAFPYASILASQGHPEKSLDILEMIQSRKWSTIPREGMIESGLFECLENHPRWKRIINRWETHS